MGLGILYLVSLLDTFTAELATVPVFWGISAYLTINTAAVP
jgi:hypothetical protein